MRGISRASVFKPNSRESGVGVSLAAPPAGVDSSIIPVVVGADALLHNPRNLSGGSVNPATSMSPDLRANIAVMAVNRPIYPVVSVSCTAFAAPGENTYVYVIYSKDNQFQSALQEQGITSVSGAVTVFHLADLEPGTTYYLKVFARYKNKDSVWSGNPIIINTPGAPPSGLFGNVYYIAGQPSALSFSGTGEWNGVYYINGQISNLTWSPNLGWHGVNQGIQYFNGSVAQGNINGNSWVDGMEVSTQYYQTGTGVIGQIYYNNYFPYTGYVNGNYYLNGVASNLNSSGSGVIAGAYYQNGALFTGLSGGVYYINGQATTLSSNGTGTWNNQYYSAGAYIGSVGNPYNAGQNNNIMNNFNSGITYG